MKTKAQELISILEGEPVPVGMASLSLALIWLALGQGVSKKDLLYGMEVLYDVTKETMDTNKGDETCH